MSRLRPIAFFGTPSFAVPTLDALSEAGLTPDLVVSQPDRPVGRGRRLQAPPVAEWAVDHRLPLEQPERVRDESFLEVLEKQGPGVAVVVAFGQIFPPRLLRIPDLGCVNLHASLLPRYRGAAPVQAALWHGDTVTGVTTMLMEEGLDTGPILLQRELEISPRETAGELGERLAQLGAGLMVETLRELEDGQIEPRPQDEDRATHAPRLTKDDGSVDWRRTARQVFDQLRAMTPWPGLHAHLGDRPLKIVWAEPCAGPGPAAPGTFQGLSGGTMVVACGEGTHLGVVRVQRPGRKVVTAVELVNGERLRPGERLK